MIDNTALITNNLLDFKEPGDFYVCHVIQRAKDKKRLGIVTKPFDVRILPGPRYLLKDAMMLAYCGF